MYESPISIYEQIANDYTKQKDEYIYQAIIKYGISVDKEELIKALQYDREQYGKGFKEGFEHGIKTFVEMLKEKAEYNAPSLIKKKYIYFDDIFDVLEELVGEDNV